MGRAWETTSHACNVPISLVSLFKMVGQYLSIWNIGVEENETNNK